MEAPSEAIGGLEEIEDAVAHRKINFVPVKVPLRLELLLGAKTIFEHARRKTANGAGIHSRRIT